MNYRLLLTSVEASILTFPREDITSKADNFTLQSIASSASNDVMYLSTWQLARRKLSAKCSKIVYTSSYHGDTGVSCVSYAMRDYPFQKRVLLLYQYS